MGQPDCFYTSYFTVMHCHPLFVFVAIILTIIFARGLAETTPTDWTHGERFLLAVFYLFWELLSIVTGVVCLRGLRALPPLTYVCILLREEMLSLGLCYSILLYYYLCHYYSCAGTGIRSCTHNHTIYSVCSRGNQHICFNPTYCPQEQWLEIRSICNSGNLLSCAQDYRLINQCQCSLMHIQPRQGWIWRYRLWLWKPSLRKSLYIKW
jgi:hypothetical protein